MQLVAIGVCIAAGGWIFLLAGVGVGVPSEGALGTPSSVVNLHGLSIASNLIYLGYFFVLIGVLNQLLAKPKVEQQPAAAAHDPAPRVAEPATPRFSEEVREQIKRQFKERYKKNVHVEPDGSVRVLGFMGDQSFSTIEEAQTYCERFLKLSASSSTSTTEP